MLLLRIIITRSVKSLNLGLKLRLYVKQGKIR